MPDSAARTMTQGRAGIVRAMLLLVRGYTAEKNLCLTAPIWPVKHDKDMEACEDMNDKSKPAPSLVTPQARHHFTRFDQVNRLVEASEVGPGNRLTWRGCWHYAAYPAPTQVIRYQEYVRRQRSIQALVMSGRRFDNKLPYGNLPRLLLAWVCTEAVRTQSREFNSWARRCPSSCASCGLPTCQSAGPSGGRTRRPQSDGSTVQRCHIALIYDGQTRKGHCELARSPHSD